MGYAKTYFVTDILDNRKDKIDDDNDEMGEVGNNLTSVSTNGLSLHQLHGIKIHRKTINQYGLGMSDYFHTAASAGFGSFESFNELKLSIETDLLLLHQISERVRQSTCHTGKILTEEQIRKQTDIYGDIQQIKQEFEEENKFTQRYSEEAHYSQEGIISTIRDIIRRIIERFRKFFRSLFGKGGDGGRVKKAMDNFKETRDSLKVSKVEKDFDEVVTEYAKSLLDSENLDYSYYLNLNAIYYLVGDNMTNMIDVVSNPEKISDYIQDMIDRISDNNHLYKTFKSVIEDVAILVYHSKKFENPEKITEEEISKTTHLISKVYTKIWRFIKDAKLIKKENDTTFLIPTLGRDLHYRIESRPHGEYFFWYFDDNAESRRDARDSLGALYEENKEDLFRQFLEVIIKNPKKLEKGYRKLQNAYDTLEDYMDLMLELVEEIDTIFERAEKIEYANKIGDDKEIIFPGFEWGMVKEDVKVNFTEAYTLIANVTSFVSSLVSYQCVDFSNATNVLSTLLKQMSLSNRRRIVSE